jgi:hypothetical protein
VIAAKRAANELLKDCPAKTTGVPPLRRLVPKMPGADSRHEHQIPATLVCQVHLRGNILSWKCGEELLPEIFAVEDIHVDNHPIKNIKN